MNGCGYSRSAAIRGVTLDYRHSAYNQQRGQKQDLRIGYSAKKLLRALNFVGKGMASLYLRVIVCGRDRSMEENSRSSSFQERGNQEEELSKAEESCQKFGMGYRLLKVKSQANKQSTSIVWVSDHCLKTMPNEVALLFLIQRTRVTRRTFFNSNALPGYAGQRSTINLLVMCS